MNRMYIWIGVGAVVLVIIVRLCFDVDAPRSSAEMRSKLENRANRANSDFDMDVDAMLLEAGKLVGTRYVAGGESPRQGFDCSGFVSYCYRLMGVKLPNSSLAMLECGSKVLVGGYRKGDLVFWRGIRGGKVGHVGIITEVLPDRSFRFIHASSSVGVEINESQNSYYSERFVGVRRVY